MRSISDIITITKLFFPLTLISWEPSSSYGFCTYWIGCFKRSIMYPKAKHTHRVDEQQKGASKIIVHRGRMSSRWHRKRQQPPSGGLWSSLKKLHQHSRTKHLRIIKGRQLHLPPSSHLPSRDCSVLRGNFPARKCGPCQEKRNGGGGGGATSFPSPSGRCSKIPL